MRVFVYICLSVFVLVSCKQQQQLVKGLSNETKSPTLQTKYAEKLGVNSNNITNQKLYEFIDEWYAVPYKYAGKTKAGIDCSGFSCILYSTIYQKNISNSSKGLYEQAKKIDVDDLKEGDLVFFKIESKSVSHVGVYLQNNKFVHATTKKGVLISDLNEPYYKKYFYSAGRIN